MKSAFWKTDWFLGAVVVLAVLAFNRFSDLVPSLERKAYDLGVQATSRTASDKIAVIAIDDTSIANIGRWPWSREVHAKMTDLLAAAKVKVIGNTVFFSEAQVDPGYVYVTRALDLAAKSEPPLAEGAPLVTLLKEAEEQLNTDRKLAASYDKAGNVLLPMLFQLGAPRGKPDRALPEFALKNAIKASGNEDSPPLPTVAVQLPRSMRAISPKMLPAASFATVSLSPPGSRTTASAAPSRRM